MALLLKNMLLCDALRERGEYASLLIEEGVISAIHPAGETPPCEEVVDGRGKMALIPGFVNAHTHAAMVLLRGLGEDSPLKVWLETKIWPLEARLTREHIYWGTKQALLEMAAMGVTAFADMYFEMDAVVEAALETGVRIAPCRGIVGDGPEKLAEGLALADTWRDHKDFVSVQLGPHAPYTLSLPFLKEICAAGKDRNLGVHFHFLETQDEIEYLRKNFGLSPAEYLEESGIASAPSALLAHCVWLDPATLDEADFSRTALVHNPNSNCKLGSGIMDLAGISAKMPRIALGTDGAASNNRLDIWGEMRSAALLAKGTTGDPTAVPARDVLRMATLEGAKALGFPRKGLIREGWAADLVLVDLDTPSYVGVDEENVHGYLVYAGGAEDIAGTMVAGRWICREGEYPHADREEILAKAKEMRKDLLK